MFDNKNSYTTKKYSRNKDIFKMIKIAIFAFYFIIMFIFIKGILKKTNNPFDLMFISGIVFITLKLIDFLNRQNMGDLKKNYSTWGRGAGAEGVVGNQLLQLGPEYKVIPDFQNGHGNIDFIVVGPKGIFTIEVKAHSGNIFCENNRIVENGKLVDKNMVGQTWAEMNWLINYLKSKKLDFPVTGILEFPYGKIDTNSIHEKIDGIWIGGSRFHKYVISRSKNNLSKEQVDLIIDVLNKSTSKKK